MRKIIGVVWAVLIVHFIGSNASAMLKEVPEITSGVTTTELYVVDQTGSQIKLSADEKKTISNKQADEEGARKVFGGFNLGAGLMAGFDIGGRKRVQKASVINGTIRVDEESSANIGVIAEVHRLYAFDTKDGGQFGYGYFIGLVLSGNNSLIA